MNKHPISSSAWTFVACIVFLIVGFGCLHSWEARARLTLLLHGHVFCDLIAPGGSAELPGPGHTFVSKLVYCHGKCVGSLDPFAQFSPKDATEIGDKALRRATTAIHLVMPLCVVVAVCSALYLVRQLAGRSRGLPAAGSERR